MSHIISDSHSISETDTEMLSPPDILSSPEVLSPSKGVDSLSPGSDMEEPLSDSSSSQSDDSMQFYRYGWRYVKEKGPDGSEIWGQVPLTREDVLHPQLEDVILHTNLHQAFCIYLYTVFVAQLRNDPTAVVFQDTGVKWDIPGMKPHSPDVTVIQGVKKKRKQWSVFNVKQEGVKRSLVIEVTSPETRTIDLRSKKREYALAGAPLYVIIDMPSPKGRRPLALLGYQLGPEGYVLMAPDRRGRLWLEPVQLWLGIKDDQIVCYDRKGRKLGSHEDALAAQHAEADAREEAETRAAEAEARASQMEARLREIEEELRRLKGSP